MQSHGKAAAARPITAPQSRNYVGQFGRMFRELPAWEPKGAKNDEDVLRAIADYAAQMEEMPEDDPSGDNAAIPAGYTFFGQFVDHDITFDPRSSLQRANDPDNLEDFRTPAFDLDNIYGRGPDDQPYLYNREGFQPRKMLSYGNADTAAGGGNIAARGNDLLRTSDGTAIIGDMRNDENLIVSQLQLAMIKFHNEVLASIPNAPNDVQFAKAQQITRWHYQWVVIHDWLKRLCGSEIVDDILTGSGCPGQPKLCYYQYRDYPYMPVEFSVAAYRLGHSTMRARYKINSNKTLPLFDTSSDPSKPGTGSDLRGFQRVPEANIVEWCHLLPFAGHDAPQASRRIDTVLCAPAIHMPDQIALPAPTTADRTSVGRSLAYRNLLRGYRLALPSGQSVARRIGAKSIIDADSETPLWLYMLKEASVQQDGQRLGEVGARITAETFIGMLAADPSSYYATYPGWTPTLPKQGANFELADIIAFAKAPM